MIRSKTSLLFFVLVVTISIWVGAVVFTERTRTIEGIWIDLFEGSSFFEDQTIPQACNSRFWNAPWFAYYPRADTPVGRLVKQNRNSGLFISEYGTSPVAAYNMKFVGRRRVSEFLGLAPLLGIGYGHLSSFGSEIEVQRVISIEPIANIHCDVR